MTSETRHIERRSFLKGVAVVGAATWSAPTIQSMVTPAMASSSPCLDLLRFKFDVTEDQITLDSGAGAQDCLPDGYETASSIDQYLVGVGDGTWQFDVKGSILTIDVQILAGGKEAVVTFVGDARHIDVSLKAGSSRGRRVECVGTSRYGTATSAGYSVTLELSRLQISYVAGTLCMD